MKYIQPDVTPEKVINMINVAKIASSISFYEDEIATSAKRQSALHITLKYYRYVIAKVLIDTENPKRQSKQKLEQKKSISSLG